MDIMAMELGLGITNPHGNADNRAHREPNVAAVQRRIENNYRFASDPYPSVSIWRTLPFFRLLKDRHPLPFS